MKDNLTYVVALLDRSGSMANVWDSTIEGMNSFVEGQRKTGADVRMSLVQFDDLYEINYQSVPVQDVKFLNRETYIPRGTTALLDAMGRTIDELGAHLASMPESERPSKVIVVIQTDGFENASVKFSNKEISEKINHQRTKYGWEFLFLGANQDAIATANSFSITNAISYNANSLSTKKVFTGASYIVGAYASGVCRSAVVPESLSAAIADDSMSMDAFNKLVDEQDAQNGKV